MKAVIENRPFHAERRPAITRNIVLIGMPYAGKSTIGVILAKRTLRDFIDTDVLIQSYEGQSLQQIIDAAGYAAFLKVEEDILLSLSLNNHVIATGGSVIYSYAAMKHLKSGGVVVFLNVDLPTLQARISDFDSRGIAKKPGQSFADLFDERYFLYTKYADITLDCEQLTQEEICDRICMELGKAGYGPDGTSKQ